MSKHPDRDHAVQQHSPDEADPLDTRHVAKELIALGDVVPALDMAMGPVGPLTAPRRRPGRPAGRRYTEKLSVMLDRDVATALEQRARAEHDNPSALARRIIAQAVLNSASTSERAQ